MEQEISRWIQETGSDIESDGEVGYYRDKHRCIEQI